MVNRTLSRLPRLDEASVAFALGGVDPQEASRAYGTTPKSSPASWARLVTLSLGNAR
jgi:hypothetical protein